MNYENATEAAEFIRSKYDRDVEAVIVLGSGLGGFGDDVENAVKIPYGEIPHFSLSTVKGHAGQLILGEIEGVSVAVQQGRFHYYEGYDMEKVIFPMRVFGRMGIKTAIITNAAGSVLTSFKQGRLMLIRDHINMMGVNPLRGANDERFGPRFPDMTQVYDRELQEIAHDEAKIIARERYENGTDKRLREFLKRGVYCALSGPTYETPAEIRMLRMLGASAVGMSTVPEAITARHQGMRVLGISCITNLAAGITNQTINHDEVMETGEKVAAVFKTLLRRVIRKLA
ncbi:MAG: purine-nucleoside phosphorylase [Acidobacteria bacterium]|nr:purine-nucleoside phosphorylase [Acidobacteriota bacterium]